MRMIFGCAAALLGIAVADVAQLRPLSLVLAGALAAAAAAFGWRQPFWGTLAVMACATALAAARGSLVGAFPAASSSGPQPLAALVGSSVELRGAVDALPTFSFAGTSVHFPLAVRAAGRAGQDPPSIDTDLPPPAPPFWFVQESRAPRVTVIGDPAALANVGIGAEVTLEGRLVAGDSGGPPALLFPKLVASDASPPPSASDRPDSHAAADAGTTGETGSLGRWLGAVRQSAQAGISAYLPEPQASLASGVLLGGSGRLEPAFRLALQRSGLAHLVAIDGFKQVVVASAVGALAMRVFGARCAVLTTVMAIAGYTLLTGAHASAVRAALMVGLARTAALSGRVADPLISVLAATLLMATVEPRVLRDLGLQLSVSATLGIVLLWPAVRPRLRGLPRPIAEPLGLTLAVTLGSLPITLGALHVVSLVSPLAHVLAVPLLPFVLVCAALLALVSPLPPLAVAAAWIAWLPTTLLALMVGLFGSLPGAAIATGRLSPLAAMALAAVLLAWGIWRLPELATTRRSWRRWQAAHRALLAPAALGTALLGCASLLLAMRPDGQLHVEPLRLARGQAVFIRGPTGRTAVVALGRLDATGLVGEVADHLAVWEHRLDEAVALDASAERGLEVTLGRYPAARVVAPASKVQLAMGGGVAIDASAVDGQLVVSSVTDLTP